MMRLYVLLLTIPLVLADLEISEICKKDSNMCKIEDEKDVIYEKDSDGNMIPVSSIDYDYENSTLTDSLCAFSCKDICITYNTDKFKCTWNTTSFPEDVEYSAFLYLCSQQKNYRLTCSPDKVNGRVECQGQMLNDSENVMVQLNISTPSNWYILCMTFTARDLVKFDPPEITSAITKSDNLEIQWLKPKTINRFANNCLMYELKINDEIKPISTDLSYTEPDIDLARSYSIQIRTKQELCSSNDDWSEWSEIKVVEKSQMSYQLNAYVIASIVLVLPMIILAILLMCKFQKLSEKLFPSIPSPSPKVKSLLDRDDFSLAMPPKQTENEVEEGTEILQVTS